MVRWSSR